MNAGSPLSREPVENLAWRNLSDGKYSVWVNQFTRRERDNPGFEIQWDYQGDTRMLSYPKSLRNYENVQVCEFTVKKGKVVAMTPSSEMVVGSKEEEKWGLSTGRFVPVKTAMLSPNHWGDGGAGNRHHFFVLKGCRNPDRILGFFNEYLREDLYRDHRKVFEVLASKTKIDPSDSQLSGVGFSSTRRDRATFAVQKDGSRRTYKVHF